MRGDLLFKNFLRNQFFSSQRRWLKQSSCVSLICVSMMRHVRLFTYGEEALQLSSLQLLRWQ